MIDRFKNVVEKQALQVPFGSNKPHGSQVWRRSVLTQCVLLSSIQVGRGLNLTRPPFVKGSEDSNSNHRVMRNSFSRLHGLNLDQSHDSSGTVSRASPCQGSPDLSAHTDATQMRHSHSNSKSHNVVGGRVSESTRDLVVVVARFTHFSDQLKYAAGWAEYAGNGSRGFGEKAPRPRIVKRGTSMEEYTPPPYFEAVHSDPGIKAMFAVVEECLLETAQMFDGYARCQRAHVYEMPTAM